MLSIEVQIALFALYFGTMVALIFTFPYKEDTGDLPEDFEELHHPDGPEVDEDVEMEEEDT